jgi:hypothetical protein
MQGHDKRAERYLTAIEGSHSIAERLAAQGFVPGTGKSLCEATLKADPTYERCGHKNLDGQPCRVIGKGVGIRRHRAAEDRHRDVERLEAAAERTATLIPGPSGGIVDSLGLQQALGEGETALRPFQRPPREQQNQ